jgi:hypothetical protein
MDASSEAHLRMSGGKTRGKQPRDAAEDALLQLQALHQSHREATRLFLMAVREGATDAQIADALRQGLPHLTDPASLQDRRAGKEPGGAGTTEKGKQPAAKTKRTRTTSQAPTMQPALLAAQHAEKDVEENQRGSGQDAPASRCPLELELLGRRPQRHGKGKAPVRSEATHGDVSAGRITTLELHSCAIT